MAASASGFYPIAASLETTILHSRGVLVNRIPCFRDSGDVSHCECSSDWGRRVFASFSKPCLESLYSPTGTDI